jgi:ankyrin repeat protein
LRKTLDRVSCSLLKLFGQQESYHFNKHDFVDTLICLSELTKNLKSKYLRHIHSMRDSIKIIRHMSCSQLSEVNKSDALQEASLNGQFEIVKSLIENGADIHVEYDAPLRLASLNGNFEVVEFLIERGADLHAEDDQSLQWACQNGHFQVVELLIEHGADFYARKYCALKLANMNGHYKIVKFLLNKMAFSG